MAGTRVSRWLPWQGLGLVVVLLIPSRWWLAALPWHAPADQLVMIRTVAAAYGLAILVTAAFGLWRKGITVWVAVGVLGTCMAVGFLLLLLSPREYYRTVMVASVGLAGLFALFPLLISHLGRRAGSVATLVGVGAALAGMGVVTLKDPPPILPEDIFTNEYTLQMYRHANVAEPTVMAGGGLAALGPDLLVANGQGRLYRVRLPGDGSVSVDSLDTPQLDFGEFAPDLPRAVSLPRMRVNDVELMAAGGGTVLLMSHFFWDNERRCRTVHLSALRVQGPTDPTPTESTWRVLHEARPCARFGPGGDPWNYLMTGGRILPLGDGRILFTVGNPTHGMLSQEAESNLGRALIIDVETGEIEEFSRGHRNAQGLLRDAQGRLWSTEHGPKGGDELNLLVKGANYGWPVRTHGVEYVTQSASGYEDADLGVPLVEPVHAWVPSIGISNLIELNSELLPAWKGDLLIASLRGRALYRARIQGEELAFVEPIPIGLRIRDLLQLPDGRVVLWTDEGTLVEIAVPVNEASLELLTDCMTCHTWAGERIGTAPPLQGIYGRKVASVEGFEYSDALQTMGGEWTADLLNQFLRDPSEMVPGTIMLFEGVSDPDARAAIIRYLQDNR
ncbi:MAG: PQQ-dependent sugar dehydrogenase [Gemmatimonadota bacterium]